MKPSEAARQLVTFEVMSKFQSTRDHLQCGWNPDISIEGVENIDAALKMGKGVILWDSHFFFSSLLTKMAVKRAGYDLIHLSQAGHGFSPSKFGKRVFNPLRVKAEERYVAERVVLSPDSATVAMRRLLKHLKRNAVISVTVRPHGARPVHAPFMDSTYTVATGAPYLAYKCGAQLLPVYTVRNDDGTYKLVIEPPIEVSQSVDRQTAVTAAVHTYAKRLEPHVLTHPGQWIDWLSI